MRKTLYILIGLALAVGLARTADAVDWQFTGATNRTFAAASSGTIDSAFNSVIPAELPGDLDGEFDSRLPSVVRSAGYNMRSDKGGLMIIFR
jgi:hypothetical protein